MTSPLLPILRSLKFLRYIGFPFSIVDKEGTCFKYCKWEIVRVFYYILTIIGSGLVIMVAVVFKGRSFNDVVESMQNIQDRFHMKITDIVCYYLINSVIFTAYMSILLFGAKTCVRPLSKFCRLSSNIDLCRYQRQDDMHKFARKNRRVLVILYLLFLGYALGLTIFYMELATEPTETRSIFFKISVGISCLFGAISFTLLNYPVIVSSTDLVMFQSLAVLRSMIKRYGHELNRSFSTTLRKHRKIDHDEAVGHEESNRKESFLIIGDTIKGWNHRNAVTPRGSCQSSPEKRALSELQINIENFDSQIQHLDKLLDNGFTFLELIKILNIGFGHLLLIYFWTSTCIAMFSYFLVGIFFFYIYSDPSVLLITIASSGLLAVAHSFRLQYMCSLGQKLRDACKDVSDILIDIKIRHHKDLDDCTEIKLDCLRQQFAYKGYLRPRSYFKVTKNTFLQIHGTILTYIIVMLQFRVSE